MSRACATLLTVTPLLLVLPPTAVAGEVEGFTQPYREVELAAADTGLIETVYVREGQSVTAGELVAELDTKVLEASEKIAIRHVEATGKLDSTRADLKLKRARAEKFRQLLARSHATQEEVDRAEIEQDIAEAAVLIAEEELAIRRLERDRIVTQLDRRTVRSPIDGVVVEVRKEGGEFVSPADPIVLTVVQLDPLLASFDVSEEIGLQLFESEPAKVILLRDETEVDARIDFVSPVIDADSGTIRVRVRIANGSRTIRAGQQCVLMVDDVDRLTGRRAKPLR